MQNQIIRHQLLSNASDTYVMLNPTKQQIFFLPKQESQAITGKDFDYTGTKPTGYNNEPDKESENNDSRVNTYTGNSSYNPTDYIGMSVYDVPTSIVEAFADFNLYDPTKDITTPFYTGTNINVKTVGNGMQLLRIPAHFFDTSITDLVAIAANGGSNMVTNFGLYYLQVSPKYIETTVVSITEKYNYASDKIGDNVDTSDPNNIKPLHKRETIFVCDKSKFLGTIWNFENWKKQAGRLAGSVVEIRNASGILKQTKVISENEFNFDATGVNASIVMHPDTFGYDSPDQTVSIGDTLRIYPRETYFNQMIVEISYEDSQFQLSSVLSYLFNDVVRDLKTGIYEIYDNNGMQMDANGFFNGKVLQAYQVQQFGQYELRKKIKNV